MQTSAPKIDLTSFPFHQNKQKSQMDSWAPNSASSEERISFPPEDVGVKVELNTMFENEDLLWFGV